METSAITYHFQITKTANLFNFIANLSGWHFSAREAFKKFWLEETGPLTSQEQASLEDAANLFRKYSFGDKFWGKVFLVQPDAQVWEEAKKWFSPEEVERFRVISDIFLPRFEILWTTDQDLLVKWKKLLKDYLKKLPSKNIIDSLDTLFGEKTVHLSETVILLANIPSKRASGGSNAGSDVVTLEISRTAPESIRPAAQTLWHEIAHKWEQGDYCELLSRFLASNGDVNSPIKGVPLRNIFNEAVMESLLPYGYLAEKHFSFPCSDYFQKSNFLPVSEPSMSSWRSFTGKNLRYLAKEYDEQGKAIDEKFLEKVMESIPTFEKEAKL